MAYSFSKAFSKEAFAAIFVVTFSYTDLVKKVVQSKNPLLVSGETTFYMHFTPLLPNAQNLVHRFSKANLEFAEGDEDFCFKDKGL